MHQPSYQQQQLLIQNNNLQKKSANNLYKPHPRTLTPHSETNYLKPLKWLNYYKPTVNLNSTQYHFVSQPKRQKHQKVTLKNQQTNRQMTMYFQIQNLNDQNSSYFISNNKEDKSGLKDLTYLDFVQKDQQIVFNKEQNVKRSIWAKKYQPKAFYQLLTDQAINRNVLTWLKSWDPIVFHKQVPNFNPTSKFIMKSNNQNTNFNKTSYFVNQYNYTKLLLLSGPPGCGKTTLARVIAHHCGYEYAQINASDDRSAKALITKIQALGKTNSITNGKPTMIIIDQVDGALEQDGNGIKQVLTFIQNGGSNKKQVQKPAKNIHPLPKPSDLPRTQSAHHQKHSLIPRPIIFICNDPFVKGLKELRSKATVVYFRQAQKQRVVKRLKQITQIQRVYIQSEVLGKIAQIANCDIRSSLSILQYVYQSKTKLGMNPKGTKCALLFLELVNKLKLSLTKDSNTSIIQTVGSFLNQTKSSSLKQIPNLRDFSYMISKIDNPQLFLQTFFHNIILYKSFFIKRTKDTLKLYQYLQWTDLIMSQSFRYNNELDHYTMMLYLFYKTHFINQEIRKIQFPSQFFQRLNKQKQNKATLQDLISKWPALLQSTVSSNTVVKQYLYLLYHTAQTSSQKDSDILQCVNKMIIYGIQLGPRNSFYLFRPQFDALLTFGGKKLEVNLSNISRTLIEQSYQFAKLKAHLLNDISLLQITNKKQAQQLLDKLNIKNKRRKRNPQTQTKNIVKYKFIEGSGTQITYDLKFRFFFQ